jgi:hypothetical protein
MLRVNRGCDQRGKEDVTGPGWIDDALGRDRRVGAQRRAAGVDRTAERGPAALTAREHERRTESNERHDTARPQARTKVVGAHDDEIGPGQERPGRRRAALDIAAGRDITEETLPAKRDERRRRAIAELYPRVVELARDGRDDERIEARGPRPREVGQRDGRRRGQAMLAAACRGLDVLEHGPIVQRDARHDRPRSLEHR